MICIWHCMSSCGLIWHRQDMSRIQGLRRLPSAEFTSAKLHRVPEHSNDCSQDAAALPLHNTPNIGQSNSSLNADLSQQQQKSQSHSCTLAILKAERAGHDAACTESRPSLRITFSLHRVVGRWWVQVVGQPIGSIAVIAHTEEGIPADTLNLQHKTSCIC